MANRDARARIAAETVGISQTAAYTTESGKVVSIAEAVRLAVEMSALITPGEARSLRQRAERVMAGREQRFGAHAR